MCASLTSPLQICGRCRCLRRPYRPPLGACRDVYHLLRRNSPAYPCHQHIFARVKVLQRPESCPQLFIEPERNFDRHTCHPRVRIFRHSSIAVYPPKLKRLPQSSSTNAVRVKHRHRHIPIPSTNNDVPASAH